MTVLRRRGARLDDFFNNCTAMYGAPCKADIIAVHYYGCTVADLQRYACAGCAAARSRHALHWHCSPGGVW